MKHITFLSILLVSLLLSSVALNAQTSNESSGDQTLGMITTGDFNAVFGDEAGPSMTTVSRVCLMGYQAGFTLTNTGASGLVAIGYQAGYSLTTGFDNVFIGDEAGRLLTTATDNVFIGSESGENVTTGYDNTFIGEESGTNTTTGYENVFIGEDAGFSNTTGYKNVFIGNEVGISSDIGFRNTGVGDEALSDVDVGWSNSALGESAGIDIGSGNWNTMIGAASGVATEHADGNTFIGAAAGHDNNRTNRTTNANRNTFVGIGNGSSNREGEDNVGLGAFASFGSSGYSGIAGSLNSETDDFELKTGNRTNTSRTTFLGANADAGNNDVTLMGYSSRVDGQYGIGIGTNADVLSTGSIGIGYNTVMNGASQGSVALGRETSITQRDGLALGAFSVVDANGGISLGYNAETNAVDYAATATDALYNVALGYDAVASNSLSVAFGRSATSSGVNSYAIGHAANATTDNAMLLGGATNPLSVGIGTDAPDALASLDLGDTNKGILFNRLTDAQITTLETSLTTAHKGLALYNTTNDAFQIWNGTLWQSVTNTDVQELSLNGSNLGITNSMNTIDLSPLNADLETRVAALENRTGSSTGDMTPLMFNYQSVIRDTDGNPIKNDAVDVRIAVREDGVAGTIVYNEEHSLTSSEYGVLSLQVGGGTLISGDMAIIDWGEHEYYLEVSFDTAQSGTFTSLSTTQLLSVPYALHARSADFITGTSGTTGMRAVNNTSSEAYLKIEKLENKLKVLEAKMQQLLNLKK